MTDPAKVSEADSLTEILARVAISAAQSDMVRVPGQSIHKLLAPALTVERQIGRPYFVWKDDPDLARWVNDHLATTAH